VRDRVLVEITEVLDDDTGVYAGDDLDFTVKSALMDDRLKDPKQREAFAKHLEGLAMKCRKNEYPFKR